MRRFLSLVVTLAVALAAAARTAAPEFTNVEVVGWDFSGFDEKIREAVSKAYAPGAGEAERRAAAEALSERADFLWSAGNPLFYKHALGDYRHVLRLRPDDAEARERADTIVSIYKAMGRPIPKNGELKSGEGFLFELFRTTPKRLSFEPGRARAEGEEVSDRVAFVYQFDATAGQALAVKVETKGKGAAVFDLSLRDPAAPLKLVSGARSKRLLLPSKGNYLLRVYSKGGSAEYELKAELR
ncbi:MAG TPA: PPC domain-containing protein [Pyrinomonadaceae bacterium]